MTRTPVESRAFAAVGYDPESKTLEIQFHPRKDGSVTIGQFKPVEQSVYDAIMAPGNSAGRTWIEQVKNNPEIAYEDVTDAEVAA